MSKSILCNSHPGKLGVIEIKEETYADILLVNGNLVEKLELFKHPNENPAVIMKDGKIYIKTIECREKQNEKIN